MMRLLLLLGVLVALSQSSFAEQKSPLAGSWKIVSLTMNVEGQAKENIFGEQPLGHMILTPEGRMISVVTANDRQYGTSDARRAELLRTMYAYSGTYHVKGDQFTIDVDASWNAVWNGTQQVRSFKIDGNRLSTENAATQEIARFFPNKSVTYLTVWERE